MSKIIAFAQTYKPGYGDYEYLTLDEMGRLHIYYPPKDDIIMEKYTIYKGFWCNGNIPKKWVKQEFLDFGIHI